MKPFIRKPDKATHYSGLNVLRRYGTKVFLLWLYFRIKVGPGVTVGEAMDEEDWAAWDERREEARRHIADVRRDTA